MKTIILLISAFTFLIQPTNTNNEMGMYYYLIPDRETNCKDDFPSRLSYFFEQVGGYDEYATVSQLEDQLQIELSLFQNTYNDDYSSFEFMEEMGNIENAEKEFIKHKEKTKITTESILNVLLEFQKKLNIDKDFYKKLNFNDNNNLPQDMKILYPPRIDYYSNGNFLKDINSLIKVIQCYKQNGVEYVRLGYA